MSEGIGSQGRFRNPGFLLVGQRTEPSLHYPPIFFWTAVDICYNMHFPLLLGIMVLLRFYIYNIKEDEDGKGLAKVY